MKKSFDDYLNDPRIKNEPMALRITHAMRFKVQDETKGMTPAERIAYYNGSPNRQPVPEKAKKAPGLVSS
jgi:hypothetical protein